MRGEAARAHCRDGTRRRDVEGVEFGVALDQHISLPLAGAESSRLPAGKFHDGSGIERRMEIGCSLPGQWRGSELIWLDQFAHRGYAVPDDACSNVAAAGRTAAEFQTAVLGAGDRAFFRTPPSSFHGVGLFDFCGSWIVDEHAAAVVAQGLTHTPAGRISTPRLPRRLRDYSLRLGHAAADSGGSGQTSREMVLRSAAANGPDAAAQGLSHRTPAAGVGIRRMGGDSRRRRSTTLAGWGRGRGNLRRQPFVPHGGWRPDPGPRRAASSARPARPPEATLGGDRRRKLLCRKPPADRRQDSAVRE